MNMKMAGGVVALLVVAGGSFWAGTIHAAGKAAGAREQYVPFGNGGPGGAGFARGAGGMRGAGGFAAGQIVSVADGSITIKMPGGSTQIVLLATSTPVTKAVAGSASDLTVGTEVTATGSANSDGSLTASSVQIRPAGMPGLSSRGG